MSKLVLTGFAIVLLGGLVSFAGCVSIKAPEEVYIANRNRPERIDSSRVPPTNSHEEARQKLAEAYERNRFLEDKVQKLEREMRKLKDDRDEYKEKYEREKDHDD